MPWFRNEVGCKAHSFTDSDLLGNSANVPFDVRDELHGLQAREWLVSADKVQRCHLVKNYKRRFHCRSTPTPRGRCHITLVRATIFVRQRPHPICKLGGFQIVLGILDFIAFCAVTDFDVSGRFSRTIYELMHYSCTRFKPLPLVSISYRFLKNASLLAFTGCNARRL